MMRPTSPQGTTTRSRRSWPISATEKARCSKVDGSGGRKNMINGSESTNLRGRKKYCSNTKMSTPIGILEYPNHERKAREKHLFRGKNAL